MDFWLLNLFVVGFSAIGIFCYGVLADRKFANLYLATTGLITSTYILLVYGLVNFIIHILLYLFLAFSFQFILKRRLHK